MLHWVRCNAEGVLTCIIMGSDVEGVHGADVKGVHGGRCQGVHGGRC